MTDAKEEEMRKEEITTFWMKIENAECFDEMTIYIVEVMSNSIATSFIYNYFSIAVFKVNFFFSSKLKLLNKKYRLITIHIKVKLYFLVGKF